MNSSLTRTAESGLSGQRCVRSGGLVNGSVETHPIIPTVTAFRDAHQLGEVTVVAGDGVGGQLQGDRGCRHVFILGTKFTRAE